MQKPYWIEPFLKSSYRLFANHDPASHLPFDAWGLHPLYNDLWLKKIYGMVETFDEKGYRIEDHLDLFPNLSSSRFIVLMNTIHYQTSKLNDPKLITTIQDFLVKSIELRSKDDLFAAEKNIECSNAQAKEILDTKSLKNASIEESKEIGKILVALASLTHGLYNDWCTDYDYEITGPYKIDGETVLFRSFPDLCPKDIWQDIDWDFKNVLIITTYKNLDAKIAFVGCHVLYSGNTIENLSRYSFEVDGRRINNLSDIKNFRERIMPIAAAQFEKYLGMDFESQKIKFVYQEHYQFKKLFDLVGIDWRPSAEILDRIKNKELIENIFPSYEMTLENYSKEFGGDKLIDAYSKI